MPRSSVRAPGTIAALALVGLAACASMLLMPAARQASAGRGRCAVVSDLLDPARPLPHLAARLAAGDRSLTIVALGSSSTFGTGASGATASYPARLGALLAARYPGMTVRVLNRGVPGEESPAMAARIDRDVLAAKPDLVIWQIGTNGLLQGEDASTMGEVVRRGVERIKRAGVDVMLMNPQYAPAVIRHRHYRGVLHMIDAVAYAEEVPLIPRFALMREWTDDGRMPLSVMLTPDRLHMTDVSYDCLARQVAAEIEEAAPAREDGEGRLGNGSQG